MTLSEYINRVENGSRSRVDFIKRKFYLNGKEVNVEDDTAVLRPLEEIERLYANFKWSYPSEHSERHRDYFKALPASELTDEDLVNNEERITARAKLEATFLCWVLNGTLTWEDDTKFFWQSPTDKDLIILRRWVA